MKKLLVLAVLAALVSTSAFAAITNTKHDLSTQSTTTGIKTDSNEICVFCHTPHGATLDANKYLPLWNRSNSADPTGFYDSNTMDHATDNANTIATDAYLCLSCHDGTQAIQVLNNPPNTGLTTGGIPAGGANLGTDLSNDHPIGFVYNAALDIELKAAPAGITFYGAADNEMWCSSCHDVHGGTAVGTPFLVINNAGSNLCIACHNK